MASRFESDIVQRYKWPISLALIGLFLLQAFLQGAVDMHGVHSDRVGAVFVTIIPNIIAALLGALFVYFFLRPISHQKYIGAMRQVRAALKEIAKDQHLPPEIIQDVMKRVVRAASLLYFDGPEPDVPKVDRQLNESEVHCGTCDQGIPVEDGACAKCHDIQGSWAVDRPLPTALKLP